MELKTFSEKEKLLMLKNIFLFYNIFEKLSATDVSNEAFMCFRKIVKFHVASHFRSTTDGSSPSSTEAALSYVCDRPTKDTKVVTFRGISQVSIYFYSFYCKSFVNLQKTFETLWQNSLFATMFSTLLCGIRKVGKCPKFKFFS